jgi:hypothetical protein
MEYDPIITLSSETSVEKLSGIQYQALKIISRGQVSNTFLHDLFSIQTFNQRLHELSSKYVGKHTKHKIAFSLCVSKHFC